MEETMDTASYPWLYEYRDNGTGPAFGPASEEDRTVWNESCNKGQPYMTRGYHGRSIKLVLVERMPFADTRRPV